MSTPLIELAEVPQAILEASDEINSSMRKLDGVVQLAVLSASTTTPPTSPLPGDRYIVPTSASGQWASRARRIAYFDGAQWVYFVPRPGWFAWVIDDERLFRYTGTQWQDAGMGIPAGGLETQVLRKASDDDFDLEWADPGGGGFGSFSGALVTRSAVQAIANDTVTQVSWDVETYDTDDYHDSTNPTRLTAPEIGVYIAGANVDWASGGASGNRIAWIVKNGVTSLPANNTVVTNAIRYNLATPPVSLNAGDYVELNVFQSSGGSRNLQVADSALAFWLYRIG